MENTIVPVHVQIHGKEYTVACPQGQERDLIASARRVDNDMRKIRESGKVLGSDRIAVMLALNLAHELMMSPTTATPAIPVQPVQTEASSPVEDERTLQRLQKLNADMDAVLLKYQHWLKQGIEIDK